MAETVLINIVEPGLANILKDIITDTDTLVETYLEPYNLLVKDLSENEEVPGLMSQAVVPDLIQKMAKISKENKNNEITLEYLYNQLTSPTKDNPPQADYPYSQTRILEMLVEIHGNPKDIPTPPKANLTKFKDPLLAAAVRIADNMTTGNEANLGNTKWVRKFSTIVNQIQDVIVRHMIFAEVHLIPLMGDDSIPIPEIASVLSKDAKETRALGLGENPNPEMAAILNPALVMSKEERGRYLRELGLLSSLISPQQDIDWDKKLKGVFSNAVFEFSEAEGGAVGDGDVLDFGGRDDLLDDDPRKKPSSAELENAELVQEIVSLKMQLADNLAARAKVGELEANALKYKERILQMEMQIVGLDEAAIKLGTTNTELKNKVSALEQQQKQQSGTPSTAKPAPAEKKVEVDYTLAALTYLISYLGVEDQIPLLVTKWLEINALDKLSEKDSKKKIRDELSGLIQGNERLMILRKRNKAYIIPFSGKGKERNYTAALSHKEIIEAWAAAALDQKNKLAIKGLPLKADLVFMKMQLKDGKQLNDNLAEILKNKKLASGSGSNILTPTTIDYTKKMKAYSNNNNGLRRKQNRRGAGDRVLVW